MYRKTGKRLFDLLAASFGLLLLLPLLLLLVLSVALAFRASPLFAQTRAGQHGRPFRLWKLRTMTDCRNGSDELLPDTERLRPLGRWLRRTSLDELPQLWNVLCGEMSLVGPRPLLPEYVPLYTPDQRRRLAIRPGLTGWAQVNGRNRLTWEVRFQYDLEYVDQYSLLLDMQILLKTIRKIGYGRDVDASPDQTMPRFTGSGEPVAVYGAGGFGREVIDLLEAINRQQPGRWRILGFFDDGFVRGQTVAGYSVLGGLSELNAYAAPLAVAMAIGQPATRRCLVAAIDNPLVFFPTLIHPSVDIRPEQRIELGEGCLLCAGTLLTVDIRLGRHVILNLNTTVGHDAVIGDFCALMPGVRVSGEVRLGEDVYVGTGATVINRVTVGAGATIGAGAVVTRDLPPYCTAVGVPARPLKTPVLTP